MNNKGLLIDNKNIELLRLLEKNPRAPISQLARRIGMSNPAVKGRLLRLEESGVLAGYRLELNPKELGYSVTAFVRVRPLPGHLNRVAELAQTIPEVTECHRVTGEDCFILKVFLKEISSLDRVLGQIPRPWTNHYVDRAVVSRTSERASAPCGKLGSLRLQTYC